MLKRLLVIALSLSIALVVCAQKPAVTKVPAPYTSPASGQEMYAKYCASCHGEHGRGPGPTARNMGTLPTDLTTLAKNNKGKYPEARVIASIKGDPNIPAHMPSWKAAFEEMQPQGEAAVQLRIHNLSKFVESMQVQ